MVFAHAVQQVIDVKKSIWRHFNVNQVNLAIQVQWLVLLVGQVIIVHL